MLVSICKWGIDIEKSRKVSAKTYQVSHRACQRTEDFKISPCPTQILSCVQSLDGCLASIGMEHDGTLLINKPTISDLVKEWLSSRDDGDY